MILVGGDGGEFRLGEHEGAEVLCESGLLRGRVHVHDVEARLVAVHRVQDDLKGGNGGCGGGGGEADLPNAPTAARYSRVRCRPAGCW